MGAPSLHLMGENMTHVLTDAAIGRARLQKATEKKILSLHREGLTRGAIAQFMDSSRHKLRPGSHTAGDWAYIKSVLASNGTNVKRTARETGISEATVRRWRDQTSTTLPEKPNRPGEKEWAAIVGQVLDYHSLVPNLRRRRSTTKGRWAQVVKAVVAAEQARARLERAVDASEQAHAKLERLQTEFAEHTSDDLDDGLAVMDVA